MNSQIPTQFSTKVELWNSPFREVTICFTPMIRAGCEPSLDYSYVAFLFQPLDRYAKKVEHYFMPRSRGWTEQSQAEWAKVMSLLPEGFDINKSFEQTTIDLAL